MKRNKNWTEHLIPLEQYPQKKENINIILKVHDYGNGISQKIVDKIFQPFFTTKPT